MLLRAGSLTRGGIVLKMMRRSGRTLRFAHCGHKNLAEHVECGLKCLAIEADRTIIIEPDEFKRYAESFDIAVLGVRH